MNSKNVFILMALILTIMFSACSNKQDAFLENRVEQGTEFTVSMASTTDNISSSAETPDIESIVQVTKDASGVTPYDIKAASPNHELEASIIRKDGADYDALLITGQSRADSVLLENIFYISVLSLTWIDDSRVALLGHLNPSSNVYVIVNSKTLSIDGSYYGVGFTWNNSKDRLYYVETGPHFSGEQGGDKIVDNDGHVYYETDKNTMITDQEFVVSGDEKSLSFTIRDINTESANSITIALNSNFSR